MREREALALNESSKTYLTYLTKKKRMKIFFLQNVCLLFSFNLNETRGFYTIFKFLYRNGLILMSGYSWLKTINIDFCYVTKIKC